MPRKAVPKEPQAPEEPKEQEDPRQMADEDAQVDVPDWAGELADRQRELAGMVRTVRSDLEERVGAVLNAVTAETRARVSALAELEKRLGAMAASGDRRPSRREELAGAMLPPAPSDEDRDVTPTEAVMGFIAWASTQDRASRVRLGRDYEVTHAIKAAERFAAAQGWNLPRPNWPDRMKPA